MKQTILIKFIFLSAFLYFFTGINCAENMPTITNEDIEKYGGKSRIDPPDAIDAHKFREAPAPAPDPAPLSAAAMNEEIRNIWKSVRLKILDKLSKHTEEYVVRIGDTLSIPGSGLRIELISYIPDFMLEGGGLVRSRSIEPNNQAANVVIYVNGKPVYGGWLYANYPTINHFEHERYQVLLKGGITTTTKSMPTRAVYYRYEDTSGNIIFTDNPSYIPESQRSKMKTVNER